MKTQAVVLASAALLCFLLTPPAWPASGIAPAAASVPAISGTTANGDSTVAALSAGGRFAVLASSATDLTANPNSGAWVQLYLRENASARLSLVTATPAGTAANGASGRPAVSEDGLWVVFESEAGDLVPGDTNGLKDVFLRDVANATTVLVSRTPTGAVALGGFSQGPVLTADGAWIAFTSYATNLVTGINDTNRTQDVFLLERATGQMRVASTQRQGGAVGAAASFDPVLSPDGGWLAFGSTDGRLAGGAPTDKLVKLFLRQTTSATNSWASGGAAAFDPLVPAAQKREPQNAVFSGDGTSLAYTYGPLVLSLNPATGETTLVGTNFVASALLGMGSPRVSLSSSGQVVAWPGGPRVGNVLPGSPNSIYVWDATAQTTTRIQPPLSNPLLITEAGAPTLSADGRRLAFAAIIQSPGEADVQPGVQWFLHDRTGGATTRLSLSGAAPGEPLPDLWHPLWTADLATLVCASPAADLVVGDLNGALDAFAFDAATRQVTLLSPRLGALAAGTASRGSFARGQCFSADGRFLVFTSSAADLVPNDQNGVEDIFLRDLSTSSTTLVSVNLAGAGSGNGGSQTPVISADGRYVAFASLASDLVAGDTNGLSDVFVRDLQSGITALVSHTGEGAGSASGSSYAPAMSADGQWIVFETRATNVSTSGITEANGVATDVSAARRGEGPSQFLSVRPEGTATGNKASGAPVITPDGARVLFQSAATDLVSPAPTVPGGGALGYVRNLAAQTTSLIRAEDGSPLALAPADTQPFVVSADGTTYAVAGKAGLEAILVRRFPDEFVAQVAPASSPTLSGDGRKLCCVDSVRLGGIPTRQVFVLDLAAGTTNLVSVGRDGVTPGGSWSYMPVISSDGRYVVFKSHATNLVARDANGYGDIYVRDLGAQRTLLVSALPSGEAPGQGSISPVLAPDGRTLAFLSWTDDLAANDRNRASDVYVLRLGSGPAADSDLDGLPDDWEVAYFNSLVRDGSGDRDEDGLSDAAEYRAGTDPTNEGSVLRVLTLTGVGDGGVTVLWSATPGRTYQLQFKDTVDAAWADLPGVVVAAAETASTLDTSAGASLARFYRVVLVE